LIYGHLQAAGTINVGLESPPHTPLYTYYYTAPANAKVGPPAEISNIEDAEPSSGSNLPTPVPTSTTLALGNEAATTSNPLDLNTILAMQLVSMGQMQLKIFQEFGTLVSWPTQTNGAPHVSNAAANTAALSQLTRVTVIDSRRNYSTIQDFFGKVSAQDPDRNISFMVDRLSEGRILHIDELLWFGENDLKETFNLHLAEAKWLLREVNKAVAAENMVDH
jgi:hypothetical protein